MAKQETERLSDELMADSLQVENYLKQGRTCQLSTLHIGIEQGLMAYLNRYQLASPQLQFRIFLFSSFYAGKLERFFGERRGDPSCFIG